MLDKIKRKIELIPKDKLLHFTVGVVSCALITSILLTILQNINNKYVILISYVITLTALYIDEYVIQARYPNRNSKDIKDLLAGLLGASIITFLMYLLLIL